MQSLCNRYDERELTSTWEGGKGGHLTNASRSGALAPWGVAALALSLS
jgi:hypothetical protein